MNSIKVVLPEDEKREIKKAAVDADKTISQYILDILHMATEIDLLNLYIDELEKQRKA